MKRFSKAAEVKVAVVGYGGAFNMGKHHLNEMRRAGMTPVAVAEIDPERLKVATTDFPGIETYATVDELLRESEARLVTLITPHNTHAPLALKCLKAGRHVVCEKPFAIHTAECDAMIREAKKRGLMLSTYHNRHWDGNIMEAVDVIGRGAIGKVIRIEAHMGGWGKPGDWWRTSKSISGGVLYDWGVHLLEYSLQIIRSEIVEVTGFHSTGYWAPHTKWKADTNEDEGYLVVRFRSGQWLTLCVTSIDSNPKRGMLEITGTKGSYIMEYASHEIISHKNDETIARKGRSPESQGWRYYQNVADHLTRGTKLVITAEWARRPIHIIDLAGQSAKLGRTLRARYH